MEVDGETASGAGGGILIRVVRLAEELVARAAGVEDVMFVDVDVFLPAQATVSSSHRRA